MKTLRRGSEGADVVKLQNALKGHGHKLSADGVFGPGTEKIVKQFQKDNGLQADGIVGRGTWNKLKEQVRVEPKAVLMEDAAKLFSQLLTQEYKLSGAQCPSNPPGMRLKRIGTETSNCVLFTSWFLSNAFEGVKFDYNSWKKWMCSSSAKGVLQTPGYGPRVAMDWGIARKAPIGRGPWLIQTFTQNGGHSYIVLDHDPKTGKILTLESNAWCNGVGWNQIGPLRECLNPGPNWMDKVTQTWQSRVFGPNVSVHMTEIRIEGVKLWLETAKK